MPADYADRNVSTAPAAAAGGLPLSGRILLLMSTTRWRAPSWLDPAIRARLAELAAAGWTIRLAAPRNYMLWRLGRTLNDTRLPVLVLPLDNGRLDPVSRNLFIAAEIVRAEARVAGRPAGAIGDDHGEAARLCAQTAHRFGVGLADAARILRRAWREVETRR